MPFTVATWNINSVRLRAPIVCALLEQHQPDVLCLQEIKCRLDQFPAKTFRALGYEHIAIHGQTAYHGVATLSRHPISASTQMFFAGKDDARHIQTHHETSAGTVAIDNFYIPAGGDIPDRDANEKFDHKLRFLDEFETWSTRVAGQSGRIAVGDFNIAPLADDVWSHKQLLKVVSHTPVETDALNRAQAAGNWHDVVRDAHPVPEKL
ncbi:MAG: exodeoxyribonuclease III, partial [Pseudomonadota bacterium]